ncbi:MAG: hypothetical protein WDO74_23455 [Pseudomonadota bacterium]
MLHPQLAIAIHHLRAVAEDPNDPKRHVAKNVLDDCAKRDKQRERMGLPPTFGKALTSRPGVSTFDARDHAIGAGK